MKPIVLTLPYPPSINTYWRSVVVKRKVRVLISKRGRQYRQDVYAAVLQAGLQRSHLQGRLAVTLEAYMPNRRACDLDNLPKSALDALTHAGLWGDDSQIDKLTTVRCGVVPPGRLDVVIRVIGSNR